MKIRFSCGNNKIPEYIIRSAMSDLEGILEKAGAHIGSITINAQIYDDAGNQRSFMRLDDDTMIDLLVRPTAFKTKDNKMRQYAGQFPSPDVGEPEAMYYWKFRDADYEANFDPI